MPDTDTLQWLAIAIVAILASFALLFPPDHD